MFVSYKSRENDHHEMDLSCVLPSKVAPLLPSEA